MGRSPGAGEARSGRGGGPPGLSGDQQPLDPVDDRAGAQGRLDLIQLLARLDIPPVRKKLSLDAARRIGAVCEIAWTVLRLKGEPPMTRFVASELAKDHWFSLDAARRELGYAPRVSMARGLDELVESMK